MNQSKILNEIHDMNTLIYVVIHEMAHVACPEYGHTKLFKEIFPKISTDESTKKLSVTLNIVILLMYFCKTKIELSVL